MIRKQLFGDEDEEQTANAGKLLLPLLMMMPKLRCC
jgi:hypothetical protein